MSYFPMIMTSSAFSLTTPGSNENSRASFRMQYVYLQSQRITKDR